MTRILTPVSFWKPIGPIPSFISKYTTTTPNEDIHLPYLEDGTYSGTIDWGDGTITNNSYDDRIHTYVSSGTHTVTIDGQIIGYNHAIGDNSTRLNLVEITQWGLLNCGNMVGAFSDCRNLILDNVTDVLNITSNDLSQMFLFCESLITCPYMDQWNTSSVTNMTGMFNGCSVFDQPLDSWDTSSVLNMRYMFFGCGAFNRDLSDWCVQYIATIPSNFATNTPAWTLPKPVWGTCPP